MKIEILTIGDEILSGQILDTNKAWLSEQLWQNGFEVRWHTGIRDDEVSIVDAITRAQERADAVVVTGGLGPTADDFTIEIAARAFGVSCDYDAATIEHLQKLYTKRGRALSENNRKQALIPKGGKALFNRIGTAPGVFFPFGNVPFYFTPGVPTEMKAIYTDHILPDLLARRPEPVVYATCQLRTFGCPESELDNKLRDLYENRLNIANVRVGFRVAFPDIFIKLSAWEKTAAAAQAALNDVREKVIERVGSYVYADDERTLEHVFVAAMRENRKTVAVAESCTGGLIANRITNVSGASDIFLGGVVSYANAVKQTVLKVPASILEAHGAVSAECAEAMVRGVQRLTQAEVCAAVTGIAGPTGGSNEKPVGTVHIATLVAGDLKLHELILPFPREMFKAVVASLVLQKLLQATDLWPGLLPPTNLAY
jgi:nicotinamide-nucleotide amidase